jgi:Dolichyl-phosphate-mannose-protein mannosyltransferase
MPKRCAFPKRLSDRINRRAAIRIALGAAALRLVSALIAWFANLAFPPYQPVQTTMFGTPSAFWDSFTRWDSGWYFQVARYGYHFVRGGPGVGVGKPGKIAYFPIYPLLMRGTSHLFGSANAAFYLGGILVSWLSFVLAMVALYYLARLDLPRRHAERAVLLTAIFPFAFFFGMVYTEALFLLLTVVSFYAFRTRRWIMGGICGGLATATRPTGILMIVALAWIAWRNAEPTRRDRSSAIVGLVLVAAGVGIYSSYVYRIAGNPFEWARSITRWGYYPGGLPWMMPLRLAARLLTHPYLYLSTDPAALYDTLYGVTGIAFVVLIPFVWMRFGAGYGLFMLLNLWVPLSSGAFEGVGRYCCVLFPAFLWLGSRRSRAAGAPLIVCFALLYTLALALFATIHPLY